MPAIRAAAKSGQWNDVWETAKQEAKAILAGRAKSSGTITYAELTSEITTIHFGYHDFAFDTFLRDILIEEDEQGRGLLSALVVLQETGMPAKGFFVCAAERGYDVSDPEKFWVEEIKRLFAFWQRA